MESTKGPIYLTDIDQQASANDQNSLPLVSIVLPCYNEATILQRNLETLCAHLRTLEDRYSWELVVINDGSADKTGEIADAFAKGKESIRVYHHRTNFGLGQAFKFAFGKCRGDYIVTLDIDLSYSPDHIDRLLEKITKTGAKMVLASPYMEGGKISNVPRLRRFLSINANRFLSFFAHGNISTLTCMVRAYDGNYIRGLKLRATGMDIMPETIYKTMVTRARIEQIPAHLDWGPQAETGRISSMRILKHIISTLLSGFILRPFMFFVLPGLMLLAFSLWVNTWMVIHFFEAYFALPENPATDATSSALAAAYAQYPHTFIIGLLSLMLAIQLISLGILALQSKQYFEEIFHLGSSLKHGSEGVGADS